MPDTALQFDLPHQNSPGIWPWVIGVTAFLLLAYTTTQLLQRIPQSLASLAQQTAQNANATAVDISVAGRDLTLTGTVGPETNRDEFVQQLTAIDGVRVVVDDMQAFDPAEQARLELLTFRQLLGAIDTSQVVFEPSSASLTAGSTAALDQLADLLLSNSQFRVRVAGHTDNTGRAEVNVRIADYLASRSVDPSQIIAKGYGATQPIADNASEAGRARNRRIEISYVD